MASYGFIEKEKKNIFSRESVDIIFIYTTLRRGFLFGMY